MKTLQFLLCFLLCCASFISEAQWISANGPEAAPYYITLGLAQNDDKMFVGYNGGAFVYSSTNDGLSWSGTSAGSCSALTAKGNIVIGAVTTRSINMSTNGGASFFYRDTDPSLNHANVWDALITDNGWFIASQGEGVIRSTDGGNNWAHANTGIGSANVYSLVLQGSTIYAGTDNGIYTSTDSGNHWSYYGLSGLWVHVIKFRGNKIYAGVNGAGIYRSANNGVSWDILVHDPATLGIQCMDLDEGSAIMVGNDSDVFYSTNDGATWTPAHLGISGVSTRGLMYRKGTFYVSSGRGVLSSDDKGLTWKVRNHGIYGNSISGIAVKDQTVFAGGSSQGAFRSSDGGTSWEELTFTGNFLTNLDGQTNSFLISDNNVVYAGSSTGIWRSDDMGDTWVAKNNGLEVASSLGFIQKGTTIFALSAGKVWKSTNKGDSWTSASNGLPFTTSYLTSIHLMGTTIFVSSNDHGVYRSSDDGLTWQQKNTGLPVAITQDLTSNGSVLFAGTNGSGVYRSSNQGDTWQAVNNQVKSTFGMHVVGGMLFASDFSCNRCTYISQDNGDTWQIVGDDNISTYLLNFASYGDYIYAGSQQGGVYKHSLLFITQSPEYVDIGEEITIQGIGFDPVAANNTVRFSGVSAIITDATSTSLKVIVPTTDNGLITVAKGSIQTSSTTPFKINPRIDDFTPKKGPAGTIVTVTGVGFTGSKIFYFGTEVTPISAGPTSITFKVPNPSQIGRIEVHVGSIQVETTTPFIVVPTISSISPLSGPPGTIVTINGNGFNNGATFNEVRLNDEIVEIVDATPGVIHFKVPADATSGKVKITANGSAVTSDNDFIIPHTVGAPVPNHGFIGQTITINGTGLNDANAEVRLGGKLATIIGRSDTQLQVIIPPGSELGTLWQVTIKGITVTSGFVFQVVSPSITSFSPTAGRAGKKVAVYGVFSPTLSDNTIYIGGQVAEIVDGNEYSMNVIVPTNASTTPGPISESVYALNVMSLSNFTITDPTPLTVTSYTPTSGFAGTSVTLTGTGFNAAYPTTVTFAGYYGSVVSISPTEIVVKVPNYTVTGQISLSVVAGGVQDIVNVGDFTFLTSKFDQQITFNEIGDHTFGDDPFQVSALASSGLAVALSTSTVDNISIENSVVSFLAPGQASITASQEGSDQYNAATPVTRTFCVDPVKPAINITGANGSNPTITSDAATGWQWYKDGVKMNGETLSQLHPTQTGTYTLQIVIDGCKSEQSNAVSYTSAETVTGLEEPIQLQIRIYPNPVQKILQVELPSTGEMYKVSILGVDGRVAESRSTTESNIAIDVANYATSIYLIRAESNGKTATIRFVKN